MIALVLIIKRYSEGGANNRFWDGYLYHLPAGVTQRLQSMNIEKALLPVLPILLAQVLRATMARTLFSADFLLLRFIGCPAANVGNVGPAAFVYEGFGIEHGDRLFPIL